MILAEEKKKTNIAEYVILMYQTQDLIRAYNFDMDRIREEIVLPQSASESMIPTIEAWYADVVKEMKARNLEKKGHLHVVQEAIQEIIYLHNTLLTVVKDKKYEGLFESAHTNIEAFRKKSDLGDIHPVEICFKALYMKMLMKLQKKEISAESENAFDSMRILLAYLTKAYHQMKSGNMDMFKN